MQSQGPDMVMRLSGRVSGLLDELSDAVAMLQVSLLPLLFS